MGKRELKALERERAERHAARCAVYAKLWGDPKYVALVRRKERLFELLSHAQAYRLETIQVADRRYRDCLRRMFRYERAAFQAAGLPY